MGCTRVEGLAPNEVKTGDRGLDGRGKIYLSSGIEMDIPRKHKTESGLVIAQVKGGGYTASKLRDFLYVIESEKASAGVFIIMRKTTTSSAFAKAGELGTYTIGASSYPKLQF